MACSCERQEKLYRQLSTVDSIYSENLVYMDYNSTTPVLTECLGAFETSCRRFWGNPSSPHAAGLEAWKAMEENRAEIASFFRISPDTLYFCSSASEALFTAVHGAASLPDKTLFITLSTEHAAVINSIKALNRKCYEIIGVNSDGTIQLDRFESILEKNSSKKIFMVYSPVNHETGAVQPVKEIYKTAQKYRVTIIMDAVQAAARIDVSEWKDYCSMFAVSSHKLYAPKGCGLLYKSSDITLKLLRFGGSQEKGLFPGTENTPAISAFAKSLLYLGRNFPDYLNQMKILTSEGINILKKLPFEVIIESPPDSAPGIICISIPSIQDMEKFIRFLITRKICISRFSACTEDLNAPSVILLEMGRERFRAEKSLRISLGIHSRREDFFSLSKALSDYAAIQDKSG